MRKVGCDIACHHYAVARGEQHNEYAVIVMEHVTGDILRSPYVEIDCYREEIINSVSTLHRLNAISSDISRENVLITNNGVRRDETGISYKLFMAQKKMKSWTKALKNSFTIGQLASWLSCYLRGKDSGALVWACIPCPDKL